MLPIRKTLYVGFLGLTIFSILFASYTMYLIFETNRAARSLKASISDIDIKEETSEVSFLIEIYNPSNIHLGLYNYKIDAYLGGQYIASKQSFKSNPLPLRGNTATNLSITVSFNNQTSHSNGSWRLDTQFMLETPLAANIIFPTVLEK